MEILRHTQISQTRRYVKGPSHLSKDAMRRMGDTFLPAPEPALRPRLRLELRLETAARLAPVPADASVKSKSPGHPDQSICNRLTRATP